MLEALRVKPAAASERGLSRTLFCLRLQVFFKANTGIYFKLLLETIKQFVEIS